MDDNQFEEISKSVAAEALKNFLEQDYQNSITRKKIEFQIVGISEHSLEAVEQLYKMHLDHEKLMNHFEKPQPDNSQFKFLNLQGETK